MLYYYKKYVCTYIIEIDSKNQEWYILPGDIHFGNNINYIKNVNYKVIDWDYIFVTLKSMKTRINLYIYAIILS